MVWPSGAARAASAVPMVPIAPGLFSITNGWPSDSWSCGAAGLEPKIRSLVVLAMMAAINRPAEFSVHVRGALANGATPDEIREVLLMLTMYCGIPAANDAHRIAAEILNSGQRP